MFEIILSQITDPLRIGLLAGLVVTMKNTETVTGRILPLILGVIFVATLLPVSFSASNSAMQWTEILIGLISNAAILAVLLGLFAAYARFAGNRASK
ncbi:MAG: hypothetical protein ACRECW_01400 [Phyllobacterium sp.]